CSSLRGGGTSRSRIEGVRLSGGNGNSSALCLLQLYSPSQGRTGLVQFVYILRALPTSWNHGSCDEKPCLQLSVVILRYCFSRSCRLSGERSRQREADWWRPIQRSIWSGCSSPFQPTSRAANRCDCLPSGPS